MSKRYVSWFSAGITSTVATMIALDKYGKDNVDIIFFETGSHHPDNNRFIKECEEKLFKKKIEIHQNPKYNTVLDVLKKGYINSPYGAFCTYELKKQVRFKLEKQRHWDHQIFGFEFEKKEINRAVRFKEQYPATDPIFPLIDAKITKVDAIKTIQDLGVEIPEMYKLGYANNNCIMCVKGGMGYFNKMRKDFPKEFKELADLEKEVGATCLKEKDKTTGKSKKLYLHDLDPNRGREQKPITSECGVICATEFTDVISEDTNKILKGELTMKDVKDI